MSKHLHPQRNSNKLNQSASFIASKLLEHEISTKIYLKLQLYIKKIEIKTQKDTRNSLSTDFRVGKTNQNLKSNLNQIVTNFHPKTEHHDRIRIKLENRQSKQNQKKSKIQRKKLQFCEDQSQINLTPSKLSQNMKAKVAEALTKIRDKFLEKSPKKKCCNLLPTLSEILKNEYTFNNSQILDSKAQINEKPLSIQAIWKLKQQKKKSLQLRRVFHAIEIINDEDVLVLNS